MSDKLKLLLLAANSVDTVDPRASDEIRAIHRAIQAAPLRGMFKVQKEPSLRDSDIGPLLLNNPDILHIAGHSRGMEEGLMLEDDLGRIANVPCAQLKDILFSAGTDLQLVFLAYCHSATCAKELSTRIDFVLGIEGELTVESSLAFAPAFYAALASGSSIREAVDYGKSILGLGKLPGADAIVLLVRDGADATKSAVKLNARDIELKSILQRAVLGTGSEMDRSNLRKAIDDGVLVLSQRETEDAGNQQADLDIGFTEDLGILQAGLSRDAYRKVRAALNLPAPGIAPPPPPRVFLGREDSLQHVKRLLTVDRRSRNGEKVTVIHGWPGVGKTSLVSAIGHDIEIAGIFKDGVLWISLEQQPNIISAMDRWGRALGSENILKAPTVKDATAQLTALLRKRNMLLIVDDVWETGHAAAFSDAAGEECSVMITTRLPKIAEALTTDQNHTYKLPVLTEEFALMVLRVLVPEVVSQNETECRTLVRDLECLPLALHVAAGLLRSEVKLGWGVTGLIERLREGTELINRQAPKDRIEKDGNIPSVKVLLQRSTDVLDEQTRESFICLGAFAPKPATFDLSALQAVWQVDDPKPTVRQLVGHGLLEPVGRGRFQMHRILVDHARSLCTED
jgi:hypothetical protein